MGVEESTHIGAHKGELVNSKSEWRQLSIMNNDILCIGTGLVVGSVA